MGYSYQQLTDGDVPLFKELLGVFGDAFGEPDTYRGAVPSDAYLEALLRKPHVIALAAEEGGRVVGGLVAYVLENFMSQQLVSARFPPVAPPELIPIGTGDSRPQLDPTSTAPVLNCRRRQKRAGFRGL